MSRLRADYITGHKLVLQICLPGNLTWRTIGSGTDIVDIERTASRLNLLRPFRILKVMTKSKEDNIVLKEYL